MQMRAPMPLRSAAATHVHTHVQVAQAETHTASRLPLVAGLPLPYAYEPLLCEVLFGQMLRLPRPQFKPIMYSTLMVDLCKLRRLFPRAMSACVRWAVFAGTGAAWVCRLGPSLTWNCVLLLSGARRAVAPFAVVVWISCHTPSFEMHAWLTLP